MILKSTHQREMVLMEARIAELKNQITDLKRLVFVPLPSHAEEHPIRAVNAILDGQEVMPQVDEKKEAEDMEEANRILSGSYDRFEESW